MVRVVEVPALARLGGRPVLGWIASVYSPILKSYKKLATAGCTKRTFMWCLTWGVYHSHNVKATDGV